MSLGQQNNGRLMKLFTLSSQFLNVILSNGSPDETISGKSYRRGVIHGDAKWKARMDFINKIFFWSENHCKNSYLEDYRMAEYIYKNRLEE